MLPESSGNFNLNGISLPDAKGTCVIVFDKMLPSSKTETVTVGSTAKSFSFFKNLMRVCLKFGLKIILKFNNSLASQEPIMPTIFGGSRYALLTNTPLSAET